MSKHEAELRRRVADNDNTYDTMCWFLSAIGAQAYVDGGPEPDLSWFEREYLKANIARYHEERMRRMSIRDLIDALALEDFEHPERPLLRSRAGVFHPCQRGCDLPRAD
jgi:hypothetical protein